MLIEETKMIDIDTYALYYAAGISTHKDVDIEKLKDLISSQEIANQYWKKENDDHLMESFKKFPNNYNKFSEKTLRVYANEIMYK